MSPALPATNTQVRETSDYQSATAGERAAIRKLVPTTELVHEKRFKQHSACVARDIVGEERCAQWPDRHINEEAPEDLRTSYASIRLGPPT